MFQDLDPTLRQLLERQRGAAVADRRRHQLPDAGQELHAGAADPEPLPLRGAREPGAARSGADPRARGRRASCGARRRCGSTATTSSPRGRSRPRRAGGRRGAPLLAQALAQAQPLPDHPRHLPAGTRSSASPSRCRCGSPSPTTARAWASSGARSGCHPRSSFHLMVTIALDLQDACRGAARCDHGA